MTHDALPPDDPSLAGLERRLAGWAPAPAADPARRDRLLFEAGAQAGRRRARRQAGALGLALLVGLGGWGWNERRGRARLELALAAERSRVADLASVPPSPRPAVAPPRPAPRAEPPDPSSYLALARRFDRDGLARLDPAPPSLPGTAHRDRATPILTPRSRPGAVDPLTL